MSRSSSADMSMVMAPLGCRTDSGLGPSVASARIRRRTDRRARERPGVPLLDGLTTDDLPVAADTGDVVFVAQGEHEAVNRAAGGLHVVTDDPGLDEAAVAVDLDVLVPSEVHGGVVHEETFLEALEIVIERALLHGADDDAVGVEHRANE